MAYIYKKIIGKKPYYYLRASERKGKRIIVKDIAYLGNSISEVKKKIKNIPKYKDKIRKAYKTIHNFLESNYYLEKTSKLKLKKDIFLDKKLLEIKACKLHYNKKFQKNDEITKKETWKNFLIEFAFNTTSIEGNTITLNQARNLLEEGLTPKNKTLREIYDLQNTEKVFLEMLESKKELNHELINNIHSKLMKNIDTRIGYRTSDVKVVKSHFKPTPFPYIKTDLNLLIKWYNENKKKMHPLVLASIFHHKFEKIHPFYDGNGRTGRMIMNLILMKHKYPPLIIHKKNRPEYLDSLGKADKSGLTVAKKEDYFKLIQFIADELTNHYWDLFL